MIINGVTRAMIFIFLLYLSSSILCPSSAYGSQCDLLYEQQSAQVSKMNYQSFDQTRESGFRVLGHAKCFGGAAKLIHMYLAEHDNLNARQVQILRFHAGQMNAMAGGMDEAVSDMMKAIDHAGIIRSGFLWNDYVFGSVAFLKQDRPGLERAIDALRNANDRKANAGNLGILTGLARCFGKSYEIAYVGCDGR